MYSSALTVNSQTYARIGCDMSKYYYETIEVIVSTSGFYSLSSNGSIITFNYIYKGNFNPFNHGDWLKINYTNCNDRQTNLIINLQANTKYILVVTTYFPNVTGTFLVLAWGPNNVTLNTISEY